MTALFPATVRIPRTAPRSTREMLRQGKWWRVSDGEWVKIKKMTPTHRMHCANLLLRRAVRVVARLDAEEWSIFAGAPDDIFSVWDRECDARNDDPEAFIRGTALYRRLTKGFYRTGG